MPATAQAIGLHEQHLSPDEAAAQVAGWTAGWAMSDRWRGPVPKTLWIQLDSDAGTQIVAGGGMTAAYLLTTYHHGRFERFTSAHSLKMFGLTTVGCFALTPIIGAGLVGYNEHRELRSSEVFMMVGDCVVPIIGGLLMKAAFDANPQWDAGTGRPTR